MEHVLIADQDADDFVGYHPFLDRDGYKHGSFEVFWCDDNDPLLDDEGDPMTEGWYWWACHPGCIADGEPQGPFADSTKAYKDAQSMWR